MRVASEIETDIFLSLTYDLLYDDIIVRMKGGGHAAA